MLTVQANHAMQPLSRKRYNDIVVRIMHVFEAKHVMMLVPVHN